MWPLIAHVLSLIALSHVLVSLSKAPLGPNSARMNEGSAILWAVSDER